jgi:DNA-binding XRE family transcriptional regulator
MKLEKRKALEAAGFRIGSAADFLGLSDYEQSIVELRLAVGQQVRTLREKLKLSQQQLAARIQSSQSRVAKIEAATPGVSLDLAFRGFFAVGGKIRDLAKARQSRRVRLTGHANRQN